MNEIKSFFSLKNEIQLTNINSNTPTHITMNVQLNSKTEKKIIPI
jgi:hypothetical protein